MDFKSVKNPTIIHYAVPIERANCSSSNFIFRSCNDEQQTREFMRVVDSIIASAVNYFIDLPRFSLVLLTYLFALYWLLLLLECARDVLICKGKLSPAWRHWMFLMSSSLSRVNLCVVIKV